MRKVGIFGVVFAATLLWGADWASAQASNLDLTVKGTLPFGRLDFSDRLKAGDRAMGGGARVRVSVIGEPNGAVVITVGKMRRVMQFERRPRTRKERVSEAKNVSQVVLDMVARVRELKARAKQAAAAAPKPAPRAKAPALPPETGKGFKLQVKGFFPFSRPDLRAKVFKALPVHQRPRVLVDIVGATNGAVYVKMGPLSRVVSFEKRFRNRKERVKEAERMARVVVEMVQQLRRMRAGQRDSSTSSSSSSSGSPSAHRGRKPFSIEIKGLFPFSRPDLREKVLRALPPKGHRPRVQVNVEGGQHGKVFVTVESLKRRFVFERRHRSRSERVAEAMKMANNILQMIAEVTGSTVAAIRADAKRIREEIKRKKAQQATPSSRPAAPGATSTP